MDGPSLYFMIPMGIIASLVICGICFVFGVIFYRLYKHYCKGSRHPHIYRPPRAPYNNVNTASTLPIVTHDSNPVTVRVYSSPPPTDWAAQPPPPPYNPNYPKPDAPPSELVPFRTDDYNKNNKNSFG